MSKVGTLNLLLILKFLNLSLNQILLIARKYNLAKIVTEPLFFKIVCSAPFFRRMPTAATISVGGGVKCVIIKFRT